MAYTILVAAYDALTTTKDRAEKEFICDGTNDEDQINGAIAALPSVGGCVLLSEGTFTVSSSISIARDAVVLQGMGRSTNLCLANSANTDLVSISGSGTRHVQIRNMFLDGNKANNSSGCGIAINTPYTVGDCYHLLEDLIINNCYEHSVEITGDTRICLLSRIHAYFPGQNCYYIAGSDHEINRCIAEGAGRSGFYFTGYNVHLVECKAFGCAQSGDNNWAGFQFAGGILIFCTQCEAQMNQHNGFFTDSSGNHYNSLFNCYAESNGQAGSGNRYGARIYSESQFSIIGGFYGDRQGSPTQTHGISIEDVSTGCIVTGTHTPGNITASIVDSSSGSNIIRDNVGFVTENSGTGTIENPATSDVITHGLSVTPTAADISITLTEDPDTSPGAIWISNISSTQFTVNCENAPGASHLDFSWAARVL